MAPEKMAPRKIAKLYFGIAHFGTVHFGIVLALAALASLGAGIYEKLVIFLSGGFLGMAALWDIRERRIPNKLNLSFGLTALVLAAVPPAFALDFAPAFGGATGSASAAGENFMRGLSAGILSFLVFLLLHTLRPSGLGMGDVKLVFGLGIFLGWFSWEALFFGLAAAIILNAVIAVFIMVFSPTASGQNASGTNVPGTNAPEKTMPFAPALASGSLLGLLLSFG